MAGDEPFGSMREAQERNAAEVDARTDDLGREQEGEGILDKAKEKLREGVEKAKDKLPGAAEDEKDTAVGDAKLRDSL